MKKLKRNERVGALMHILTNRPNNIFTYNYFAKMFNASKTSISEDIVIIKEMVKKLDLGYIETISGAAGGVKFTPKLPRDQVKTVLNNICAEISRGERLVPGGFIYMTDILYAPNIIMEVGKIFATYFINQKIDYVVTVETKGIPIALMTAQILNVPLVIIRRNTRVTEGPTVSINYVSGSTKRIQTMSLSKRAIKQGSKVLVIDDFMKAGGTAKGIKEMMWEFKTEVKGIGVLISTEEPKKKLVDDFISLLVLKDIDEENKRVYIEPNMEIINC